MKDIDWLAVDWVVTEGKRLRLRRRERLMVMRRVHDRMARSYSIYDNGLSAEELAVRLGVNKRTVERLKVELPHASKRSCPVCRQPMWVLGDGTVEEHPDSMYRQCPMSGEKSLTGLAAERPDLYRWVS